MTASSNSLIWISYHVICLLSLKYLIRQCPINLSSKMSWFWKKVLLLKPSPNSIFNCHNPKGIKLLTRLRLGLRHLCDDKFMHSFQDLLNPICNCGTDTKTTPHDLLHCSDLSDERLIFVNNIWNIENNLLNLHYSRFSKVLLFGNFSLNNKKNKFILNTTIEYIVSSKRFDLPLFDSWSV